MAAFGMLAGASFRNYRWCAPWITVAACLLTCLAVMTGGGRPAGAQEAPSAVQPAQRTRNPLPLSPERASAARNAGLDPAKLAALRAELAGFVTSGELAGAVALIGRRGRVGFVEALGRADLRTNTPMRTSTLFRLDAMSKVATAAAVLMLRDEGKLALTDPVAKHLPAFCGQRMAVQGAGTSGDLVLVDPRRVVTIADLLRERTGFDCAGGAKVAVSSEASGAAGTGATRSLRGVAEAFAAHALLRNPGERGDACDAGFAVAGRIIEVVGGQPFEAFMQARLFAPLGMTDATYRPRPAQRRRLATVYRDGDAGRGARLEAENRSGGPRPVDPARGLHATAAGHARLLQLLLDGGTARGRRFLHPESVAEMLAIDGAALAEGGARAGRSDGAVLPGLGLSVVRTPGAGTVALAPGSYGSSGDLGTHGWVNPGDDVVYVLMTQQRSPAAGVSSAQMARQALQSLGSVAIVRRSTEPKRGLFSARRSPSRR